MFLGSTFIFDYNFVIQEVDSEEEEDEEEDGDRALNKTGKTKKKKKRRKKRTGVSQFFLDEVEVASGAFL